MKDIIRQWSVHKVQFLLEHLEDFIEDDENSFKARATKFQALTDLDKVERLTESPPSDPETALLAFERLSLYYDVGLMIQRGPASHNWWVTDCFWKGNLFHLTLEDQVSASKVIPEIQPLQVHKAHAGNLFKELRLDFFLNGIDGAAYLMRPIPHLAYVLVSSLPAPWATDQVERTHKLVNKCFLY